MDLQYVCSLRHTQSHQSGSYTLISNSLISSNRPIHRSQYALISNKLFQLSLWYMPTVQTDSLPVAKSRQLSRRPNTVVVHISGSLWSSEHTRMIKSWFSWICQQRNVYDGKNTSVYTGSLENVDYCRALSRSYLWVHVYAVLVEGTATSLSDQVPRMRNMDLEHKRMLQRAYYA